MIISRHTILSQAQAAARLIEQGQQPANPYPPMCPAAGEWEQAVDNALIVLMLEASEVAA